MERVIEKLKTESKQKKLIVDCLIEHSKSEPAFIEKVLNDNKSLDDCCDYINSLAKKEAVKGVAVIEKETVYGWAIHYFDEEKLEGWKSLKEKEEERVKYQEEKRKAKAKLAKAEADKKTNNSEEVKPIEKKMVKKPKGVSEGQISIFDL